MQAALKDLPKVIEQEKAKEVIRENLRRDYRWYVKKCVKFQVAWSRLQGQRYFSN